MWLLHASSTTQFWFVAGLAFLLLFVILALTTCVGLIGGAIVDLIVRLCNHQKFNGDLINKAFQDGLSFAELVALSSGVMLFVAWLAFLGALHQIDLHYVLIQLLHH